MVNQAISKEAVNCYPPIGGPAQARKLQYDLTALQAAQLRRGIVTLSYVETKNVAFAVTAVCAGG